MYVRTLFDSRLQIRLSSEEYLEVKDAARRKGMTISSYARAKLLDLLTDGDNPQEELYGRFAELEDSFQGLDTRLRRLESLAEGSDY